MANGVLAPSPFPFSSSAVTLVRTFWSLHGIGWAYVEKYAGVFALLVAIVKTVEL